MPAARRDRTEIRGMTHLASHVHTVPPPPIHPYVQVRLHLKAESGMLVLHTKGPRDPLGRRRGHE